MNRGNKLWVGHRMILPQYVEVLQEKEKKEEPPRELDEQWKEELDWILEEAKERQSPLRITVQKGTESSIIIGVLERMDPELQRIQIRTKEKLVNIQLNHLRDVEWVEEL